MPNPRSLAQLGLRLVVLFSALVLGVHTTAWACSCARQSFEDDFANADLVVYGTVLEIGIEPPRPSLQVVESGGCGGPKGQLQQWSSSDDRKVMRVEVLEAFKGSAQPGDQLILETVVGGSSCGLGTEEGEDWLIYSWNGVHTSLCTRSSRVDDPATHWGLAELDTLE